MACYGWPRPGGGGYGREQANSIRLHNTGEFFNWTMLFLFSVLSHVLPNIYYIVKNWFSPLIN